MHTFCRSSDDYKHGIALYFEDDKVALNTYNFRANSYHEIMLDRHDVEQLIATLQAMKTDISTRYPQKELNK